MAEIPTIPGSARVQDQQVGAKRNVQPRLQALGAVRGLAKEADSGVQQAIGAVAEYEAKKQKAEEGYAFNMTSLGLQKLHSDFLHKVKTTPDEQIVPNWTQASAEWKQQQLDQYGGKLSPRAKQALTMNLDMGIGEATAKFQVVADKLGSQWREGAAVANWNEFLKSGDPAMADKAMAALKLAQNAGDITPDKVAYYKSQVPQVLQKNQILNGIEADPYRTLKDMDAGKYADVPKQEFATLRNTAEKQVAYVQRTTASDFINDFSTSGLPKSDKELQEAKEAGKVTGEFVKNYKAMVERKDYHEAQDKQAVMLTKLRDLDLSDSDNPEKEVRKITDEAASLPPQLQKEIYSVADARLKAAKKGQVSTEQPIHKTQLDLMKSNFEDIEKATKLLPQDYRAKFGHKAKAPNIEDENLRYAKAQKEYIDWSKTKKGAEATPEQAAAERERLGFGRYSTQQDVVSSFQKGHIDRATAKQILRSQFGIQ